LLREVIEHDLTEKQRQVLSAELSGVPHAEIATRLGMNRNALYKLGHDARRRVKARLEAAGVAGWDINLGLEGGRRCDWAKNNLERSGRRCVPPNRTRSTARHFTRSWRRLRRHALEAERAMRHSPPSRPTGACAPAAGKSATRWLRCSKSRPLPSSPSTYG